MNENSILRVRNIAIAMIVSSIFAVLCFLLKFIYLGAIGLIIGIAVSLVQLGYNLHDLLFFLLPFMFYINVGGAINTSLADFVLLIWVIPKFERGVISFGFNNTICYKSYRFMRQYGLMLVFIMFISLVNVARWENPLILPAFISIAKIVVCGLYSFYTLEYIDRYGRERFLKVMAFSALFFYSLMIVGVIGYYAGIDLGLTFPGTFRATGTFEDPNLASTYVFLMASFAMTYFSEKHNYILFFSVVILGFVSVILTSSKGAFVALICGLVGILIITLVRGKIATFIKLLIIYFCVGIIFYTLYDKSSYVQQVCEPIFNRINEFTGNISGDHSLAHRKFLWRTAFQLGMSEPLLGIGIEQFRPAASQYTNSNVWNIVHNTYLTFFCELGVLGIISFFSLWIKNILTHIHMLRISTSSIYLLFSSICVSLSMWSISLGNFRNLWVFMTFMLYEYNRVSEEYNSITST